MNNYNVSVTVKQPLKLIVASQHVSGATQEFRNEVGRIVDGLNKKHTSTAHLEECVVLSVEPKGRNIEEDSANPLVWEVIGFVLMSAKLKGYVYADNLSECFTNTLAKAYEELSTLLTIDVTFVGLSMDRVKQPDEWGSCGGEVITALPKKEEKSNV